MTDGSGNVLTAGSVNQDNDDLGSFVNGGTVEQIDTVVTVTAHVSAGVTSYSTITVFNTITDSYAPTYYENEVGQFVATSGTAVVTMEGAPNSSLIVNTALVVPIGLDGGSGDDFHVQAGSPAIDAGDPTTPFLQEPSPNGGRVNLGYDGDTPQAQLSPSGTSIQVLSPGGLAKYQIGEQLPINFQTDGLTSEQPVLLLHAGGPSIATALDGNWSGDAFRTDGQSMTDTESGGEYRHAGQCADGAVFLRRRLASSTPAGDALNFDLPVANGTYTLNLYFADPSASAAGQRVFNIVANGQTLQADYDIFAAAKSQGYDGNHAVSLSFTVTVTGGAGLTLDFVNVSGPYGALVNGIALEQANAAGSASPTATVEVLANGTLETLPSGVQIVTAARGQQSPRACQSTPTARVSMSGP